MKALKKSAGFFLIELLIVMVIIGILVVILMPSYNTYVARSKFQSVILKAEAIKASVGACMAFRTGQTTFPSGSCAGGDNGVLPDSAAVVGGYTAVNNIQSWQTQGGTNPTITVRSIPNLLGPGTPDYTYTLTGTVVPGTGDITWARGGTCINVGLC